MTGMPTYSPLDPPLLPLLSTPPQPNARAMADGSVAPIRVIAAAKGPRQARKGALFAPQLGGCFASDCRPDPDKFPHIWPALRNSNGRREWACRHPHSDGSKGDSLIYSFFPSGREQRAHNYKVVRSGDMITSTNRGVRLDWGSTGKMTGAGEHVLYSTGTLDYFAQESTLKRKDRIGNRHDQSSAIEHMRKAFDSAFTNTPTEYDEMIADLTKYNRIHPACDFTVNFSCGEHIDTGDSSRSFTRYARRLPAKGKPSLWFIFPHIGLAIEIDNGICISWDGRKAAHLTSVPWGLDDGDQLFAAFFALTIGVERCHQRTTEMRLALDAHNADGHPPIASGSKVWVRWYPLPEEQPTLWRRATGRLKVRSDGDIEVCWPDRRYTLFTPEEASRDIVPAGKLAPQRDIDESSMVGKTVRVYWSGRDDFFAGSVVAYDMSTHAHTIEYNCGEVRADVLGSRETPYFVFEAAD